MKDLINIKPDDFTRVKSDIYGNPRYVVHFTMLKPLGFNTGDVSKNYEFVINLNKKLGLGGKKYHNKSYGGGLVFQSYSLTHECKFLNEKLNEYFKDFKQVV
jgi:hypothetical protein